MRLPRTPYAHRHPLCVIRCYDQIRCLPRRVPTRLLHCGTESLPVLVSPTTIQSRFICSSSPPYRFLRRGLVLTCDRASCLVVPRVHACTQLVALPWSSILPFRPGSPYPVALSVNGLPALPGCAETALELGAPAGGPPGALPADQVRHTAMHMCPEGKRTQ